jgi:voltage-gated potassium channel
MEPHGAPPSPDGPAELTVTAPAAYGGQRLRRRLRALYFGSSPAAARFQHILLSFDIVTLGFFLVTSFVRVAPWVAAANLLIALALTADFGARCWIAERPLRHLLRSAAVADLVVIASLLASALVANLGFLRVLRTLRLLRSYHVLGLLRRRSAFVRRKEQVIVAALNVVVFVFFVTAVVYVTQHRTNPEIGDYADALYFTVATLTTTGFGDVTLVGRHGRLLSVLVMVVGISLFVRLVQAVFRPARVRFPCPACGLQRHEPDAVHCRHCGHVLNIPDEGD